MDTITERIKRRFTKAIYALEKACALPELPERADRDAVLLRFELAAELMPKVLKRILSEKGLDVVLPKDSVRAATGAKLIQEDVAVQLLAIIDDRNRMVHDYSEEFAEQLLSKVKQTYCKALQMLIISL